MIGVSAPFAELAVEGVRAKPADDAQPGGRAQIGAHETAGVFEIEMLVARRGRADAVEGGEALAERILIVILRAGIDDQRECARGGFPARGQRGARMGFVLIAFLLPTGGGETHETVALHLVAVDFGGGGEVGVELGVAVQGKLAVLDRAAVGVGVGRRGARGAT